MNGFVLGSTLALALGSALSTQADIWDTAADDDNGPATQNYLIPGPVQAHDFAVLPGAVAADEDWYVLSQMPYSSYEVILDAWGGDVWALGDGKGVGAHPRLDRLESDGTTVITSAGVGVSSHGTTWQTGASGGLGFLRAYDPECGLACGADDQYRIRIIDTTCSVPRFNNSATQTTILILQNTGAVPAAPLIYFWSANGTLLSSHNPIVEAKYALVINTATLAPGQSGSLTVTHDIGHGQLAGKAVALEPATGFTFDTPLTCRGE